jgi:hypothetical protein
MADIYSAAADVSGYLHLAIEIGLRQAPHPLDWLTVPPEGAKMAFQVNSGTA